MVVWGISGQWRETAIPDADIFDVVVVGGGPAGSAAAFSAAKGGLRVCLIDKSRFPREKLCGGLITQRSKSIFERVFNQKWNDNLFNYSDDVEFYYESHSLGKIDGYSRLYFTMRRDFDAYLLNLAERAGVELKLGTRIDGLDFQSNTIHVEDGPVIEYSFLIGADGVNSQVAKEVFGSSFDRDTIAFGLEVEVPKQRLPDRRDLVEIDFGAARWGYGWIFPKLKTFTIGVGGIHKLNPDLKERFAKYLSLKGLDITEFDVKGQYIPFGSFRTQPGKDNVLLCGDAAGVVDPITAEGIAYAMQSGHACVIAVLKATCEQKPTQVFDFYSADFRAISKPIRQAKLWRYLIFPLVVRKTFAWAFSDAGTLQRGYLDILAGKHEYDALYKLFLVQLVKAIRKLFRILATKIKRIPNSTPR